MPARFEDSAEGERKLQHAAQELIKDVLVRAREGPALGLRRCEHVRGPDAPPVETGANAEADATQRRRSSTATEPEWDAAETCAACALVRESNARVAGWLCLNSSSATFERAVNGASALLKLELDPWRRRYAVFDPSDMSLSLYKTAGRSMERPRRPELTCSLSDIKCVRGVAHKRGGATRYSFVASLRAGPDLRLKAIEDGDAELVSRWMALLTLRGGLYPDALDDLARAASAAVRAVQRAFRERAQRAGASATPLRLSARLLAPHSPVDRIAHVASRCRRTLSDSCADPQAQAARSLARGLSSLRVRCQSLEDLVALSRRAAPGAMPAQQRRPSQSAPNTPASEERRWVPAMGAGEEEDEVWENQRWSPLGGGWSHHALLPHERGAVTDRLGHAVACSLLDMNQLPLPRGWALAAPFMVDTSLVAQSRCDAHGWRYESHFSALDAKQARGAQRGKAGARWVVRHRRWYRRRRPDPAPTEEPARAPAWAELRGWLGMRGLSTGVLWRSRYCVLALPAAPGGGPGAQPRPRNVSSAFWGYLSGSGALASLSLLACADGDMNLKPLDGDCAVSDEEASADFPGYFSLHLSGESQPRLLNAGSRERRTQWVRALRAAIAASARPRETLVRLKQDAADEDLLKQYTRRERADSVLTAASDLPDSPGAPSPELPPADCDGFALERTFDPGAPDAGGGAEGGSAAPSAVPAQFAAPPHLENVLLDDRLPAHVDVLMRVLFEDDAFHQTVFDAESYTAVQRGDWEGGDDPQRPASPGARRVMSYRMPRKSPMPENTAQLKLAVTQAAPGVGFQVEQTAFNPDVPYGRNFETRIRFVLTPCAPRPDEAPAGSGGAEGERHWARLVVSHEVHFLADTVMRGFVRSGSLWQIRVAFESWSQLLRAHLGAMAGAAATSDVAAPIAVQAGAPFTNVLVDARVPMDVDGVHALLCCDARFQAAVFAADKARACRVGDWSEPGAARAGCWREVAFTLSGIGPLPKHEVSVREEVVEARPGQRYTIDHQVFTPHVPFGGAFKTHIRFTLEADGEGAGSRVVVSHRAEVVRGGALARNFLVSFSTKEVAKKFERRWLPLLRQFAAGSARSSRSGSAPSSEGAKGAAEGGLSRIAKASLALNAVLLLLVLFLLVELRAERARTCTD